MPYRSRFDIDVLSCKLKLALILNLIPKVMTKRKRRIDPARYQRPIEVPMSNNHDVLRVLLFLFVLSVIFANLQNNSIEIPQYTSTTDFCNDSVHACFHICS